MSEGGGDTVAMQNRKEMSGQERERADSFRHAKRVDTSISQFL